MGKTVDLNLKVNAFAKKKVETVLDKLGISMSEAVDMFLYDVALKGDITFRKDLPPAPPELNADLMTDEELAYKLKKGYDEVISGRYMPIDEFMEKFEQEHNIEPDLTRRI